MDLAIPIFRDDKKYVSIDIMKPRTGIIGRTYELITKGQFFKACLEFVSGCVETIYDEDGESETDSKKIKRLCGMMPYVTAEAVALQIMMLLNEDDYIEGVYICPRCGEKIITGADEYIDTRDRVSELKVIKMNGEAHNLITVELSEPVKIKNIKTGDVIEEINSFDIRYPTLNDCIFGENGSSSEIKTQLRTYCHAIIKVNGEEVNNSWISTYGMIMIDRVYPKDLRVLGEAMERYGIVKMKERECLKCGKIWDAPLNTSNFFASGLRPTK